MNSNATVFIVDDDPAGRESVAALVASLGITPETYESAESFLESYDRSRPGCVVTDLRMLGMSGLELLDRLEHEEMRLPVIIVTGYADVPVAVRAIQQGAVTLLEKPCRDHELWDAVRKSLMIDAEYRRAAKRLRQQRDRLESISPDERQVLELVVDGKPNKLIAKELDMGLRTVESRRQSIMSKLEAASLAELVRIVVETGWKACAPPVPLGGGQPPETAETKPSDSASVRR